jgi:hypothetical protein
MPIRPYVYVTCPFCCRPIKEPFARKSGPVPFRHSVCKARLLVSPDPERHNHSVMILANGISYEQALINAYEAA